MVGEEKTRPPGSILRQRTLPLELELELELPVEDGGGLRRRSLLANGLRHHRSDESDYRLRDRLLDGSGGGYTSLRDMLPSPSAPSPTGAAPWTHEGEISIRNRLVKQAAYAYLQPMAALSPGTARGRGCIRPLCCDADGCLGFVGARLLPALRRALSGVFAVFRWRRGGRDR